MSARRLVQRPQARRDILSIVSRIADQNPPAASAVFDAYEQALSMLRSHPEAGRRYIPDHAALGNVRMIPIPGYDNYLIFTRYDGDTIELVRVLHGARDILAILERS